MRLRTFRWIFVLAALVVLASWQSRRLYRFRQAGLPEAYAGYSADVPPVIAFVMAGLGGFRGIASEVLWFRVNRLQEEGRYLELVQLANWLTMLDPHASEAWVYNAWNLAYNVSVMMIRAEDRLRWVRNGIELLRDDGLRFNPRDARLYRELAWFYQNKVGDSLDNAHLTYKFHLAESMAPCVNADGTVAESEEAHARLSAMRLDAARMAELEGRFGPLDWRLADAHALYWASRGLEFATGTERMMSRRAVYQPLMLSVFNGRFTGDLARREWRTASNPGLALAAADFMCETAREFPTRTVRAIIVRFLAVAAYHMNRDGHAELAGRLYERLLEVLPEHVSRPGREEVMNGWGLKYEIE